MPPGIEKPASSPITKTYDKPWDPGYTLDGRIYTIKKGESYSSLAKKFLRDEKLWPIIWWINGSPDNPDILLKGTSLYIPQYTFTTQEPVYKTISYTVRDRDTLSGIAKRFYGKAKYWRLIQRDNPQIRNPKKIKPGDSIKLKFRLNKPGHTLKAPGNKGPESLHMKSLKIKKESEYYADAMQYNGIDINVEETKRQIISSIWTNNKRMGEAIEGIATKIGETELYYRGSNDKITINGKQLEMLKITYNNKSYYLSAYLLTRFGTENFIRTFINAVKTLNDENRNMGNLPPNIVFLNLSGSPHLFEDHIGNGFVGINQSLLDICEDDKPAEKQLLTFLLQTGMEHELLHETGITDEQMLKERDAKRILHLCKYPRDIRRLLNFVSTHTEIDKDLKADIVAQLVDKYCTAEHLLLTNTANQLNTPLPAYGNELPQKTLKDYLLQMFDYGFLLILNIDNLKAEHVSTKDIRTVLDSIITALQALPIRSQHDKIVPLKISYDSTWRAGGTTSIGRHIIWGETPKDISVNVNEPFNSTNIFLHEWAHYKWAGMGNPGKKELETCLKDFLKAIGLEAQFEERLREQIHELVAYTAAGGDVFDFIKRFVRNYSPFEGLNEKPEYSEFRDAIVMQLKINLFKNPSSHYKYKNIFSYTWPYCYENEKNIRFYKGWLRQNDDATWTELTNEDLLTLLSQYISIDKGKALLRAITEKFSLTDNFEAIEKLFSSLEELDINTRNKYYSTISDLMSCNLPGDTYKIMLSPELLEKIVEKMTGKGYFTISALAKLASVLPYTPSYIYSTVLRKDFFERIIENSKNPGHTFILLAELLTEDPLQFEHKSLEQIWDILQAEINRPEGVNLKAPGSKGIDKQAGSDSMDEDRGERRYIEEQIQKSTPVTSPRIIEAIALIPDNKPLIDKITFHKIDLGKLLGIPRFKGATKPQDLIYAYGRKEADGKLHIYVTKAFWEKLTEETDDNKIPLMLSFLIDHEWQENMLDTPKTHREASQRAWDFTDKIGMNPFYKFYIDLLVKEQDIESLVNLLEEHPNDPRGKFKSYVLKSILMELSPRLQDKLKEKINAIENATGDSKEERIQEAQDILKKLEQIHPVIEELLTESGMASCLVYEKLENILYDILRKGDEEGFKAKVNLMCISLPMAELNKLDYKKANIIKRMFYIKVKDYFIEYKSKPRSSEGTRVVWDELSGQYYGFSQTKLLVIGLNENDFSEIQKEFIKVLTSPEIGISREDAEKYYRLYAGHTEVSLENRTDIQKKFADAKTAGPDEKKELFEKVTSELQDMVVNAMREVTGRAEAAEKSPEVKKLIKERTILGESDRHLWEEVDEESRKIKDAIYLGRSKTIPENEYTESGWLPRLGHTIGYLQKDLYKNLHDGLKEPDVKRRCANYIKYLNQYTLWAFQDKRYKKSYKKPFSDSILMAWRDGTLQNYVNWLKGHELNDTAEQWNCPIKMTKMGDEIWLYFEVNGQKQQVFIELGKFNAFNEQYPADLIDSFYHQLLDSIFYLYNEMDKTGNFTLKNFSNKLEKAILDFEFIVPEGEIYREGFIPESKSAEIEWFDENNEKQAHLIKSVPVLDESKFTEGKIQSGMRVSFRDLKFHHTEKLFGKRLPLFTAKKGSDRRRVVIYERRIFTADGKEDITDWIMINGYTLSPLIASLHAETTTDTHSLTNLDPYIISNLNTWQKKNTKEKVMDTSEIITRQIMAILAKNDIKIADTNLENILLNTYHTKIKVNFMEIWELLKAKAEMTPEQFFEIAVEISKPLNTLLGPEAKAKGALVLNALLKEILEGMPEKEEILEDGKLTDEEKLLNKIKELAAKRGIDSNSVQSIFDLFKGGISILKSDPGLDPGQIDGSYFTLIEQLSEITGINTGRIMNAFKKGFGADVKITKGQIIEGSILWKETKKFKEYLTDNDENFSLDKIDGTLWISDFHKGTLAENADYKSNRYLSGLDSVSKDVKYIINRLKSTSSQKIMQNKVPVGIIYHLEDYITFHNDGTFSYKPGIEAVIRAMETGVKIVFIIPDSADEKRARAIFCATGKLDNSIYLAKDFENALVKISDIKPENIVYAANNESNGAKHKDRIEKTIVITPDSAFHVSLIFAILYAQAGPVKIGNDINPEIRLLIKNFLKLMDCKDAQIEDIILQLERDGFFKVTLIRIKETLEEFKNRRISIDAAA